MKDIAADSPLLYLTSISLLLIIISLMIFRRKLGDIKAGRYLLGYFFTYLYLVGITYFFVYGNPNPFMHLLRTGHMAAMLMPVFAFFYIRQNLYPKSWRWGHLWHLLPIAFFLVDFGPFFLLPATEKLAIFNAMDAVEYRIGFSQGWFMPTYGHVVIRIVVTLAYWIAQAAILLRASKENFHPLRMQYPFTWRWLQIFLGTQALMLAVPIIGVFLSAGHTEAVIYSLSAAGTIAVQCFYLLLHPEILYTETFGKEKIHVQHQIIADSKETCQGEESILQVENAFSGEDKSRLPEMNYPLIEAKAHQVMNDEKGYLKQGYTLHQFATDTGLSAQKLSAFINTRYGINFNDYVNKYRIAHVVEKLKAGENTRKTLEAIAQEGGFQSRGTFIRAFKKEHGMTPSEFLSQIEP